MSIVTYLTNFVLENTDVEEDEISMDATFDDLGLDSLCFVEMQVGIAKEFGVTVLPQVFMSGKMKTLADVAGYVSELMQAKNAKVEKRELRELVPAVA
jgi:acyl carrier protein